MFLGSYPITPASDILHELSKHKHFGIRTVQAEDEIAAAGMALGAAFAGHLGVTTTSGPGVALKSETISLAVSLELPLLIIDIQRGGPSTGLPTKTEAADLKSRCTAATARRRCPSSPRYSPSHCFDAAIEAARIALKYRTPVILLSDGYLANGSEPWRLPDCRRCPTSPCRSPTEPNHVDDDGTDGVLAVPARPRHAGPPVGDPGHARADAPRRRPREGGRHRATSTTRRRTTSGWSHLRAAKIAGIANDIPPVEVHGDADADLLVLGWGSHVGAIDAAVQPRRAATASKVAWMHLMHLNPLPANLGDVVAQLPARSSCPSSTSGQLCRIVRAEYLVDAKSVDQGAGPPVHRPRARDRHRGGSAMTDTASR